MCSCLSPVCLLRCSVNMQPIVQRSTRWPKPMPRVTSGGERGRVGTRLPELMPKVTSARTR
jgi:hypothetical protein